MLLTSVRVRPWRLLSSLFSVGRVTSERVAVAGDVDAGRQLAGQAPLGALDRDDAPVERDVHAGGNGDGKTADPGHRATRRRRGSRRPAGPAWPALPVMIPLDVLTMTMPRPPSTRGMSVLRAYTRRPGLLIRLRPETTGTLPSTYLSSMPEELRRPFPLLADVGDEAFLLEDARDLALGARGRHDHLRVARPRRVADAREHVRDGVGDVHRSYQLDFVTPGSSPTSARSRKQMRHRAKRRM